MTQEEFMNLDDIKRVEISNRILSNETESHLKNIAKKLNFTYNFFTKVMRRGDFQNNQTNKRYEKLLTLEEYEKYHQVMSSTKHYSNEALTFIEGHLDELKSLLARQEKNSSF